jgi:REP element-mobilizing transposase RayT
VTYDPDRHHRRSIRLVGYDYAQSGVYFVTLVTHGRELLFDDPVLRRVAETMWRRIPEHASHVTLDEWVVMPNHLHGIIVIEVPVGECPNRAGDPLGPPAGSLGAVVGNYKSVTTRRINHIRKTLGVPVWQRNYYERVIRNQRELEATRRYVIDNPLYWNEDRKNPACTVLSTR